MEDRTVSVYCDGACEPVNPGGYGCFGWLAYYRGRIVASGKGCVGHGEGITNNTAEYAALIEALMYLNTWEHKIKEKSLEVCIYSDSQLVVNQVAGKWAVNAPNLQPLVATARGLAQKIAATLEWIPREKNQEADALSRAAYEEARPKPQRRCA